MYSLFIITHPDVDTSQHGHTHLHDGGGRTPGDAAALGGCCGDACTCGEGAGFGCAWGAGLAPYGGVVKSYKVTNYTYTEAHMQALGFGL